jgi:hypothetical protein
MLITARPSLAPGVVAAAIAPMTVLFTSLLWVTWAGGPDELSRVTSAAGSFTSLVILSGLVELAFITLMICHIGTGHVVPLAVMLGMATLPWTVGLLGTEVVVGRVVAALAGLETSDAHNALALGVGQAMATRMLGAWMSAALLLGLGLGLAMASASADLPFRSPPQGSRASLLFGLVVAFVLAAIALLGVLEAHLFFSSLTQLPQTPIADRVSLLSGAAEQVTRLRPIRQACQLLLITLGGVLLIWQRRRSTHPARGWMGSAFLAAAVAALLMLDSHPLRLAEQGARAAGLGAASLPTDFEPLHTPGASMPRPLTALVTQEGLTPNGGARLSWGSPVKALAESLSTSLGSTTLQPASSSGITPEPVLTLLADARLTGNSVRRLLRASSLAGARAVELVGQHPNAASPAMLSRLEAQVPLFSLLAAREGTRQLLLPAALSNSVTLSWHARFASGGRLLLSPSQGGSTLVLSLGASPAEVPEVLAGTFVGLELPENVSLKELGAAADALELAGASPVVVLDPEPRGESPANGGTSTLWIPPSPSLFARKGIRRAMEVQPVRRASEPVTAIQSSQKSRQMAPTRPIPNTTIMTTPSCLEDAGAFGIGAGSGSFIRPVGGTSSASFGRADEWVTTEASRSSSPSRASASTLFMWRM